MFADDSLVGIRYIYYNCLGWDEGVLEMSLGEKAVLAMTG